MAGSVNKVILIGNVVRDPEIRTTNNGQKLANMSLATSETWQDKSSGERKERAEFHRVVIFNDRLVTQVEKYVRKGHKLYVEGALQTRKWTDQSGAEKYSTEVVMQQFRGEITMLSARGKSGGEAAPAGRSGGYPPEGGAASRREATAPKGGSARDLDDEIPF